jgi:hypothetical protein
MRFSSTVRSTVSQLAVCAALAGVAFAQASEREQAIRAQVTKFYDAMQAGKYRIAMSMVADESQDAFLAMDKPKLESYQIKSVEMESETKARVVTQVDRKIMIMGQLVPSTFPQETFWVLEGGQWLWWDPPQRALKTPMGLMIPSAPGAVASPQSAAEIKAKVEAGPKSAALVTSTSAEVRNLKISRSKPFEAEFTISNSLQGAIQFNVYLPELAGLVAEPAEGSVDKESKRTIRIRWTPGAEPQPEHNYGVVILNPFAKRYEFRITWTD